MKNILTYVILIAALFFLLSDGFTMPFPVEARKPNAMEMYFAFAAVEAERPDDVAKCECGGDGDVGDGRIRVPCPCKRGGGECQCPREGGSNGAVEVEAIPANWTYAVVISNPDWCAPCVVLDKNVLSKINDGVPINGQWKIADKEGGLTHIVVVDEASEVAAKYSADLTRITNGQNPMPIIAFIRNGQIRKCLYGRTTPQTPEQFKREFLSVR